MNKFAVAAISAAGMFASLSLAPAPAAAAPVQSGLAASVLDDQGVVEQAHYGCGCWRNGWHGWGWYAHCGGGWGPRHWHGGWGWRHGWRRGWGHHGWGHRGWGHHGWGGHHGHHR